MTTLKVAGMTCGHCERAVIEAIHGIDPRAQVELDLAAGTVTTDSMAAAERLAAAIGAEGYQAMLSGSER